MNSNDAKKLLSQRTPQASGAGVSADPTRPLDWPMSSRKAARAEETRHELKAIEVQLLLAQVPEDPDVVALIAEMSGKVALRPRQESMPLFGLLTQEPRL